MLVLDGLAQFHFGRNGVAAFQQCLAQQEARLRRIGLLLQCRLELDDRGLRLVLGDVLLRRLDEAFGLVVGAAREQARSGEQAGGDAVSRGVHDGWDPWGAKRHLMTAGKW